MANLVYHHNLGVGAPISLYGGAGLGAVNTNLRQWRRQPWRLDRVRLAGAGRPGIPGVRIRPALFAEYRYQNAHNVNAGGLTGIGNTSNNLSVGVKFHM